MDHMNCYHRGYINDGQYSNNGADRAISAAAQAREADKKLRIKKCVLIDGGHFWEETTSTYPRAKFDGSPLVDGKWYIFECLCGERKVIQDIHKEDIEKEREHLLSKKRPDINRNNS